MPEPQPARGTWSAWLKHKLWPWALELLRFCKPHPAYYKSATHSSVPLLAGPAEWPRSALHSAQGTGHSRSTSHRLGSPLTTAAQPVALSAKGPKASAVSPETAVLGQIGTWKVPERDSTAVQQTMEMRPPSPGEGCPTLGSASHSSKMCEGCGRAARLHRKCHPAPTSQHSMWPHREVGRP